MLRARVRVRVRARVRETKRSRERGLREGAARGRATQLAAERHRLQRRREQQQQAAPSQPPAGVKPAWRTSSAFGQLALRRLLSAPGRASGCPEPANHQLSQRPYWPRLPHRSSTLVGASRLCSGFRRRRRQHQKPSASRADDAAAPGVRTSRRRVANAQGLLNAQGRTGSMRVSLCLEETGE